jgi:hypothetical protein
LIKSLQALLVAPHSEAASREDAKGRRDEVLVEKLLKKLGMLIDDVHLL